MGTVVQAHEVLGDLAALHGPDRREGQLSGHVAGGVDVLDVRAAVVIDRDVAAAVDLDARLVEPEVLAVRDRPDGQHRVRPFHHPPVLACDAHRVAGALDVGRARSLQQCDALAHELVLERRRHLGVLEREHLLAGDEQRHLRAEGVEHVRELDSRDT